MHCPINLPEQKIMVMFPLIIGFQRLGGKR